MKHILLPLLLFFMTSISAQTLNYSIGQIEYKDDIVKAINIKLDPKAETIKDVFEDWMGDYYDIDLDGKSFLFFDKEFMTAKGVVIPEISSRKIDLMVKVDETEMDITNLDVFASFGYNNWIQPETHFYEFAALENIVYEFVASYLPEHYLEKVEDVQKELDSLLEDERKINEDIAENIEETEKLQNENLVLREKLQKKQMKIITAQARLKSNKRTFQAINERVLNN